MSFDRGGAIAGRGPLSSIVMAMRLLTHKSCGYQSFEDHRFVSRAAWCPCQDASPFTYVDTHAGRGVYDLIVEEVARCDAHADALPP